MIRTHLTARRAYAAFGLIGILLGSPGAASAAGGDTSGLPLVGIAAAAAVAVPVVPVQVEAGVEVTADPAATDATVSLGASGSVGPVSTSADAEVGVGLSPPALPAVPSPELPALPGVPSPELSPPPLPVPTVPAAATTRPDPKEPGMVPAPIAVPVPAEQPAPARGPRRARTSGPLRDAGPATGSPAARGPLEVPSRATIVTTPPLGSDDRGTGSSTGERIRRVLAAAQPALGVLAGLLLVFGAYLAVQRRLDGGDRLAWVGDGRAPDDEKISF